MTKDNKVQCTLCPQACALDDGQRGRCKVRVNKGGKLFSLVYGKPCAVHVDPVEKKPLYHFLPATGIFSIATAGCLLSCKCCQNWEISQSYPEDTRNLDLPPKDVVGEALKANCSSIAYTYNEPTVFYEYMYDTCVIARQKGLKNAYITCGYINQEPLKELTKVMDAANVDLKGFSDEFYMKISGGRLKPVLDSIVTMKQHGMHVELTNLIIPTNNDDIKEIGRMCKWIVENAGKDTPLHFSRFHPDYRMRNLPPTPLKTLDQARETALEQGLEYVYIGNVPSDDANSTYCPNCKTRIINRLGYRVVDFKINRGTSRCEICGTHINGEWI